jgi:hypothetical protein
MNRMLIASLLAAGAALAGHARADDITIDPNPFVSTRTRAEVQAELVQFQASGVNPWADEYNQLQQFKSDRSRADVTAEFMQTRNEVAAMNGEDSGSVYLASRMPINPRRMLAGEPRNIH